MGLLSKLLLAPVRGPGDGVLWLARQIASEVDRERNSPAAIRAALCDAERRLLKGELDEDEYDVLEADLLTRLHDKGQGV